MKNTSSDLKNKGWTHIEWWDGKDINEINEHYKEVFLGFPLVQQMTTLLPLGVYEAKAGTTSSIVGLGSQPLHTDKAHLPKPPRYVVLRCENPGDEPCSTILWNPNWEKLKLNVPRLLTNPGWVIRPSKTYRFYGQVLTFTKSGRGKLRFDPLCMHLPGIEDAINNASDIILHDSEVYEFNWKAGDTIIVDNEMLLHARSAVNSIKSSRKLLRWTTGAGHGLGI